MSRLLLRLGCLPYWLVIHGRNRLYDCGWKRIYRSSIPVVSIGNLSVGGTGKSPTVAWLARWFRERHLRVAILSRGYGQLEDGRNDEALELELQLPDVPHLQHWDRVASARLASQELDMQLLLLDDGFQHRRLGRDIDIVLIDATDPPAARWLLPAGLRREPLTSLGRADAVLITRADQVGSDEVQRLRTQLRRVHPEVRCILAAHRPVHLLEYPHHRWPLDRLRGAQVLAFCGIGNPQSFLAGVRQLGAELVEWRIWPDHYPYSAEDIRWLSDWRKDCPDALLVCTVKDWVKIQEASLGQRTLLAVAVELEVLDGLVELERILEQVARRAGAIGN